MPTCACAYMRLALDLDFQSFGRSSSNFVRMTSRGTREGPMETNNLKSMPSEELWKLREEVIVRLGSKLLAEKAKLEERLRQLRPQDHRMRRPYPKVFPKYQNPKNPTETWSGRGRHPRWLSPQLRSGKKLDDFRIHNSSDHARRAHA
jgi:DNA-binding protein H-NS